MTEMEPYMSPAKAANNDFDTLLQKKAQFVNDTLQQLLAKHTDINSDLKKAKLSKLDGTTFRRACFILADGTEQRRIVIRLKDPDATETTPKAKAYIEQTFTQATDLIEVAGNPRMRMDMVRIGMQKTPDVRFRPEFVDWSATLRIEYNTDVLTEEIIGNLLYRAGQTVGIGEGRADLGWGRFEIVAGGGK